MTEAPMTRSWRCPPGAVRKAVDELLGQGGEIAGSESEGSLSLDTPVGKLLGTYSYDGETFTVIITRKPPFLPVEMIWGRIEDVCGPPVMPT